MGILGSLFSSKQSQAQEGVVEAEGRKIEITNSPYSADVKNGIADLTKDDLDRIEGILRRSTVFISKYATKPLKGSPFASETLDFVLEAWQVDGSTSKESQDEAVELLGCAFGQGIVEELNYEWKMLTDEFGTDYTVMDKQFKIHGFPFSTVLKAIEEKRAVGALSDVKLVLKKNSLDAVSGGVAFERR